MTPTDEDEPEPLVGHRLQPGDEEGTVACFDLGSQRRVSVPAGKLRWRPAVYGIAFRDRRVLLGRSAFTGRLDIPGGAVELGEGLRQALCREYEEETGLSPEPGDLLRVTEGAVRIFGHAYQSLRFYFAVEVPETADPESRSPGEITDLRWVDIDRQPADAFAPGDRQLLLQVLDDS